MTLTQRDMATLKHAAETRCRYDAGIFPRNAGDRSHFAKLARLGLLEFDGWGRDIDGEVERDVAIYQLTPAGEQAIAAGVRP